MKNGRNRWYEGQILAQMPHPRTGHPRVNLYRDGRRGQGWALHFADLDIDTRTPAGVMAANIIAYGDPDEVFEAGCADVDGRSSRGFRATRNPELLRLARSAYTEAFDGQPETLVCDCRLELRPAPPQCDTILA